jgi:hypothetical protein
MKDIDKLTEQEWNELVHEQATRLAFKKILDPYGRLLNIEFQPRGINLGLGHPTRKGTYKRNLFMDEVDAAWPTLKRRIKEKLTSKLK